MGGLLSGGGGDGRNGGPGSGAGGSGDTAGAAGGPGDTAGAGGGPADTRMRPGLDGRTSTLNPFPPLAGLPPSGFPSLPQGALPQAGIPAAFPALAAGMPSGQVPGIPAAVYFPAPMALAAPGGMAPQAGLQGNGEAQGSQLTRAMAANLEKLRAVLQETEQIAQQMEELLNQESRARAGGKTPGDGRDASGAGVGDGRQRGQGTRPLRVRKA